jgi:hypothetical protein
MPKQTTIVWLPAPAAHNYPAAVSYLSLIYDERRAASFVARLKRTKRSMFLAKDIFRASGSSLLGVSNGQVKKNKVRIKSGHALSPILLVRDTANGRVIVADGYHRLCAVYTFDEDAIIPCRIV